MGVRARMLARELLGHDRSRNRRFTAAAEAAEIREPSLIAAAGSLGVMSALAVVAAVVKRRDRDGTEKPNHLFSRYYFMISACLDRSEGTLPPNELEGQSHTLPRRR